MGLCASSIWVRVSFPILGKFSAIISSNIFSGLLCLLSPFWDPYDANGGMFNVVPEVPYTVLISFFVCFSVVVISTTVFHLINLFFCLTYSAADSFLCIFHFRYCILLIFVCLLFKSFTSLLRISCKFSMYASILILRSWNILTVINLNSFSNRLFISSSFSCFFVGFYLVPLSETYFFVISFFSNFLCLWSPFHRLQGLISFASGIFLLVDNVGLEAYGCFLVRGSGIFSLVGRTGSHPGC